MFDRHCAAAPGRGGDPSGRPFPVLSHRLRSRRLAWEFRPVLCAVDPGGPANADLEPPARALANRQLTRFGEAGGRQALRWQLSLEKAAPSADPLILQRLPDSMRERSAITESGAASGQRMPFPDYVSAQGPVPTPWTQVDPVVFSRLHRAAPGELQRPCGCAWSNSGRMVENVSRRARSVDVFQQGRFLFPCQPLTSPLPKTRLHRTRGRFFFKDRLQ